MKITFPTAIATNNPTIIVGETHATSWKVTAEQLAAAWNRPLEEIRQRITRMGKHPSDKELEKFDRWLTDGGMTPAAKAQHHANTNYGDTK
jgi:hypothetical protein